MILTSQRQTQKTSKADSTCNYFNIFSLRGGLTLNDYVSQWCNYNPNKQSRRTQFKVALLINKLIITLIHEIQA